MREISAYKNLGTFNRMLLPQRRRKMSRGNKSIIRCPPYWVSIRHNPSLPLSLSPSFSFLLPSSRLVYVEDIKHRKVKTKSSRDKDYGECFVIMAWQDKYTCVTLNMHSFAPTDGPDRRQAARVKDKRWRCASKNNRLKVHVLKLLDWENDEMNRTTITTHIYPVRHSQI